ncbi:hypothetical protein DCAR_0312532 [Daucus carota subsp. sativus]|uniref:BHLH domain-containing protein n=1 Tax=Daucus carota subsp. sativus TaxID=79200 RepID=A0A166B305_DAUCS|nr:hypothetical protein DCAR_0312532 [Daucus carota subsp. sativus]
MGAKTSTDITTPTRRRTPPPCKNKPNGRRRSNNSNSRPLAALNEDSCDIVTRKLDALRSLIPAQSGDEADADQLFEETAHHILVLRTQVAILHKLVELYGGAAESA